MISLCSDRIFSAERSANALIAAFAIFLGISSASGGDGKMGGLMPRSQDFTSLWWKDGFPGIVEGAPWQQCLRTGFYGLVLDTEKVVIPHLGPVDSDTLLEKLPGAGLSLNLTVDGKSYRCISGGPWSENSGPRLVESGRFFQRCDVTDLVFQGDNGSRLNVDARFEMAAWADRLSVSLSARPGEITIPAGEAAFGKRGGGFGLDGTNHFELPAEAFPDSPAFTMSFWAFVPGDYQATSTAPWLVCRGRNELAGGNVGIVIGGRGIPIARINPGGGKENAHQVMADSRSRLKLNQWNHLVLSYDGDSVRFYVNGRISGEKKIGVPWGAASSPVAFGRRQDNSGEGYYFRGVVDEIRFYNRAVDPRVIQNGSSGEPGGSAPVGEWAFRKDGKASEFRPRDSWGSGRIGIFLSRGEVELSSEKEIPPGSDWVETTLAFDPVSFKAEMTGSHVSVQAGETGSARERPVTYDASIGWHRVNLDGIEPINPTGKEGPSNDAMERVSLALSNSSDTEQVVRLLFEKTARGFRQRIGTPITGISAVLRDKEGNPTGIPVQLSKNWHNDPEGGVYAGQWFHGISQVRLPPEANAELELTIVYGHWGGVAAASHAQLSLIGWGGNQRWDQAALGSWGESICFDPDQAQAHSSITDVRPLMVTPKSGAGRWSWTDNVGGGDFFRLFDVEGKRIPSSAMQANYLRQGPCLTEVVYSGQVGNGGRQSATVSLGRTNDLVRSTYRIRLDVDKPIEFSRFVIFQVGADTYNQSYEKKFAVGNRDGLVKEWTTTPGGDEYRTEPIEAKGEMPWVSMHEGAPATREGPAGAWANRGFVIRSWKAKLGGKPTSPWIAEHGVDSRTGGSSTMDIVPPPGVTRFEPGDFVEATIEHLVVPQEAEDYYGPDERLREALQVNGNSWKMIHREAVGNEREVVMKKGSLERRFPNVVVNTEGEVASLTISGGMGYVPFTFTGLSASKGFSVAVDGKKLDQSVHGKDFWQTDYDPASKTWSQTFNVPPGKDGPCQIKFSRE